MLDETTPPSETALQAPREPESAPESAERAPGAPEQRASAAAQQQPLPLEQIPQTGVYTANLECGHAKKADFALKTNQTNNRLACRKCSNRRRLIIGLEFIEDSSPAVPVADEPGSAPEVDEHQPEKDFETHMTSLRTRLTEKDREIASLRDTIKTNTDMLSSKDAALRKYLTQVSQLTDAVNRANEEVKNMRSRQESWQKEQIEIDAADIQTVYLPKIMMAETRASLAEKSLQKELNSPAVISVGHMVKVMNFLKKGSIFCHIRRQNGKIMDVVQGRPMLHSTHEIVMERNGHERGGESRDSKSSPILALIMN